MKIRIISDLHIDVNDGFPFSLKGDEKEVFALLAGDISGNVKLTARWLKSNIRRGMFVAGNHDPAYNDIGWTIGKQKQFLHSNFKLEDDVTFLDQSVGVMHKEIPETNIVVIGSTLYTDYQYMNKRNKEMLERQNKARVEMGDEIVTECDLNIAYACRGLNDFRWGYVEDEFDDRGLSQRMVSPRDYKKWFDLTIKQIEELVEQFSDKDVIVLTHHCPSPLLIDPQYVNSNLNASYVSDLEKFIIDNKNIRAWVCGHVHSQSSFTIGDNNQLLVCNPRGYERRLESREWNPNTFIDTDTWKLVKEPYENKKLQKARDKFDDDFNKYAPYFI